MAIQWLLDKPDLGNLTITLRERNKKGDEVGYALTLSKPLKDLVRVEKYTHMRIGYELEYNALKFAFQLSREEVGIPLLNDKGSVRLWFDISDYASQITDNGIQLPEEYEDLPLKLKKNGILESAEISLVDND